MSVLDLTINIDGAARGNPGPAAYAYVIARDRQPPIAAAGCLGEATNNYAEYVALIRALERAAEIGGQHLLIRSDSDLLVKQMNGQYRVKNQDLRKLHAEAKRLYDRFQSVTIRHVPREENAEADRLCNEALDGAAPESRGRVGSARRNSAAAEHRVHEDAMHCLRAAADAWMRRDPAAATPEQVWQQLWSILEEEGIVRRTGPN